MTDRSNYLHTSIVDGLMVFSFLTKSFGDNFVFQLYGGHVLFIAASISSTSPFNNCSVTTFFNSTKNNTLTYHYQSSLPHRPDISPITDSSFCLWILSAKIPDSNASIIYTIAMLTTSCMERNNSFMSVITQQIYTHCSCYPEENEKDSGCCTSSWHKTFLYFIKVIKCQ